MMLDQLFHFVDVQLDVRVHFQIFVMSQMDLVLDVFFQVGHLHTVT